MRIPSLLLAGLAALALSAQSFAADVASAKLLYRELLQFKADPNFHELGFAPASPYRGWFERVQALQRDEQMTKEMQQRHVAIGDVLQLGLEYVTTKGKETDYTKFIRGELDTAFAVDGR